MLGWPYWATILFAVIVMAAVGMLIERIVIRPVLGYPTFTVVMITIGVGYVLRGVVTMVPGWGTETYSLQTPFGDAVLRFGGAVLAAEQLATIALTAALCLVLYLFFRFAQARRRHAGDLAEPARRLLHGHPGAAREHADLGARGRRRGVRRHSAGAGRVRALQHGLHRAEGISGRRRRRLRQRAGRGRRRPHHRRRRGARGLLSARRLQGRRRLCRGAGRAAAHAVRDLRRDARGRKV